MFRKIFSRKRKPFVIKKSDSVKNVSLNGKIVIRHCGGHDTIILLVLIDGFKERTIILCAKEAYQW